MGFQRYARNQRKMQREAVKQWHRNMPSEVREAIVVETAKRARRAAMKRAAVWCGLGMVFILASLLAFGGCTDVSCDFSLVDGGADASLDTVANAADVGAGILEAGSVGPLHGDDVRGVWEGDVLRDTGADAPLVKADGGAPTGLDDGLCWYKQECPQGHWRCNDADGTPIGDAQCLTKRNICICCDTTVPAFSCVGVSQ